MLFSEKYAPKKLSAVAGNKETVSRMRQWALQFSLGKKQKPLLLFGPQGSGKSAAAQALSSELGLQITQILPPQKEEVSRWERRTAELFAGSALFASSALAIADDVDTWHLSKVRGIGAKLAALIKDCRIPLILTAKDRYDRRLSPFRAYCEPLQFKAINDADISSALSEISGKEGMGYDTNSIKQIAFSCKGDLRAAINDLQARNFSSSRDSEKKQFEIVKLCFRSPTYKSTKGLSLGSLAERGTLKLYVCENTPAELSNKEDLSRALSRLSRADIFDGRIMRRQYWGFLRYSSDLLIWGVSSERRHPKAGFVSYGFPTYIAKMGASKSMRAAYKHAAKKISPLTHTTTKTARSYIPLIRMQAAVEGGAKFLMDFYKFGEDELSGILGISPDSLKNGKTGKKPTTKKKKEA
ncbi:hypothetical protein COU37_05990 [Candidatus Micrarchaeota archaeon CG10_big_fil_rev_8_21_14_0_10_45_29]|nr:MAG: hypothetical protein COU37_05990 [Candidatus Micrarchaeota archaeon CG10_big_fil_rev_8_21_14_0_10_45_29]